MPAKLLPSPIPTQLQRVHRQFEQWRRIRRPGTPIPRPLWTAAVAVARQYGLSRTAHALHLDSHKLKTMADASSSVPCAPASPTFVEVPAPLPPADGCECTVELEGPHGGRLRVVLRGASPPDLVPLSRVVWGRGG